MVKKMFNKNLLYHNSVKVNKVVVSVSDTSHCYSNKLGGCPFNGPLSRMKYPTRTKSTTRRCIVVRSRSRSCVTLMAFISL